MSQRAGEAIPNQPGMIQDLLKGGCGRAPLTGGQIRFTSLVGIVT
jgi:hypothetical protein